MPTSLIKTSHGHLEYIIDRPDKSPRFQAVIGHPHPEHGGSMHNKVVYHTSKALTKIGGTTLRFNFRGVGQSTGKFGDGVGEREDFTSAVEWLYDQTDELPLVIGGFSFGSMIALSLIDEIKNVQSAIGIGLPLDLYDFSYLKKISTSTLIIQGDNDDFATFEEISLFLQNENSVLTLKEIESADHFLTDQYNQLRSVIQSYYSTGSGAGIFGEGSPRHGRGIP